MSQERYEDTQLYRIRHSAAHVMAQAVLEFFPETKYTIGPPVENGFYYDFELPQSITQDDLEKIEKPAIRKDFNERKALLEKTIKTHEQQVDAIAIATAGAVNNENS